MTQTTPFTIAAPECDLCGLPTWETLHDGQPYALDGKVCGECREDVQAERARLRWERLRMAAYVPPHGKQHHRLFLEVLDPRFTFDDLTPRAAIRVLLSDPKTRRIFGRTNRRSEDLAPGTAPDGRGGSFPLPAAVGPHTTRRLAVVGGEGGVA